ncbi:MAG: hypothetical protein IH987_11345 [Planctomycetes bacterium]|nr:hypothetical protein [Planctomycetota bacterium]
MRFRHFETEAYDGIPTIDLEKRCSASSGGLGDVGRNTRRSVGNGSETHLGPKFDTMDAGVLRLSHLIGFRIEGGCRAG